MNDHYYRCSNMINIVLKTESYYAEKQMQLFPGLNSLTSQREVLVSGLGIYGTYKNLVFFF